MQKNIVYNVDSRSYRFKKGVFLTNERQNLYKVVGAERTLDEFNTIIYNSNEGSFTTFDFHGYSIRVTLINGDPWFVASDVAQILGYRDAYNMTRMLNEWGRSTHNVSTLGGNQSVTIINEPGLYHCIFNSRRPEAVEFQNWVYTYVLPSIRRYGAYVTFAVRESLRNDPSRIVELERQLSEY